MLPSICVAKSSAGSSTPSSARQVLCPDCLISGSKMHVFSYPCQPTAPIHATTILWAVQCLESWVTTPSIPLTYHPPDLQQYNRNEQNKTLQHPHPLLFTHLHGNHPWHHWFNLINWILQCYAASKTTSAAFESIICCLALLVHLHVPWVPSARPVEQV